MGGVGGSRRHLWESRLQLELKGSGSEGGKRWLLPGIGPWMQQTAFLHGAQGKRPTALMPYQVVLSS